MEDETNVCHLSETTAERAGAVQNLGKCLVFSCLSCLSSPQVFEFHEALSVQILITLFPLKQWER